MNAPLRSVATTPRPGMGALPHEGGTAFRVWAPNATAVSVVGDFNGWAEDAAPMAAEAEGHWYADIPDARPGRTVPRAGSTRARAP